MVKKRIVAIIVIMSMTLCFAPCSANAKHKPKLNKKKATINVGKCCKLKLKYEKKKVRWRSSNKKVANVTSSGCVWGKKQGKAKITARSGGKKYSCVVTVKDNRIKRDKKSLNNEISVTNYVDIPTSCIYSYFGYTLSTASVEKFDYSIRKSNNGKYCIDIQMEVEKTYDYISDDFGTDVVISCCMSNSSIGNDCFVYHVNCIESGKKVGDKFTVSTTIENVDCGNYNIYVFGENKQYM